MAQIVTRKYEVYHLTAMTADIDETGELVKNVLFDGEVAENGMTETKARKIVCEALGIDRIPSGTKLFYTLLGERMYSMPTQMFVRNATVISDTTATIEE